MSEFWMPSASVESLIARAYLLKSVRSFFAARQVLEVDTPILSRSTVTDVHLEAMSTVHTNPMDSEQATLYLQTSPEFAMKRLLCAGIGSIYQLCKSVRDDEVGAKHNPEFTMLEWYRVDFDMNTLIDEVDELLQLALNTPSLKKVTYQDAFNQYLGIDPLSICLSSLATLACNKGFGNIIETIDIQANSQSDIDMLLQLLFSHCIEPSLGFNEPVAITHFPRSQAALAKLSPDDPDTAQRFEIYVQGLELANGYDELQDADIQKQRMYEDNLARKALGKSEKPIDDLFIDALKHGLPQCAGVALGFDRLLMLKLNASEINDVISFGIDRA